LDAAIRPAATTAVSPTAATALRRDVRIGTR
jgi:hypothetical protein